MKKFITLLLMAVLCLGLISCDEGESTMNEIVGEWKCANVEATMVFNDDGTGTDFNDSEITWKYDTELKRYVTSFDSHYGYMIGFDVKTTDDGLKYISIGGEKFYHIDDYAKGVEKEYQKEYQKMLDTHINSSEKLALGQEFELRDGLFVTLTEAYLEEGALYVKASVRNAGELDQTISSTSSDNLLDTDKYLYIYNGARTSYGTLNLNFRSESAPNDNILIAPGATVEVSAHVFSGLGEKDIRFFAITFDDRKSEPKKYWIDFTDIINK